VVCDQRGESLDQTEALVGSRQQQHTAIGTDSASKPGELVRHREEAPKT
jgi:hypothetical protein